MTRTRYKPADRKPTWTSLTVDALTRADDFLNTRQIMAATSGSANQIAAALHHLKGFGVVAAMESDGVLWFYLTGNDTRSRVVGERVPEPEGNRARMSGYKRKPKPTDA